jgi:hypothetical protein
VQMPSEAVVVAMGVIAHAPHSTFSTKSVQASLVLSGQFDTSSTGMD